MEDTWWAYQLACRLNDDDSWWVWWVCM